jgi:hypothetical protein
MNQHLIALFDSIDSEVTLKELVREKREEDLHLEFKQKADSRTGGLPPVSRTVCSAF